MSKSTQPVGILLIATNKYKQFVQPLLHSLMENFLPDHQLTVFIFTDQPTTYHAGPRIEIQQYKIEPYRFPQATLYRYKIFTMFGDLYHKCSHLFYLDVDMEVVAPVGDEILAPLTAVRHPGFFKGGGSWCNDPKSTTFVPPDRRHYYYAGGFQGGAKYDFLLAMQLMAKNIAQDEFEGVMAEWHDESHWNYYLSLGTSIISLDGTFCPPPIDGISFQDLGPAYCMVEQESLRKDWGIDHISPKIIALAKNHDEIRS